MKVKAKRFWEIDALRGIAIIMMIIFHIIFDLNYFGIYRFDVSSSFWFIFARLTASIFIFLVGVSLTISYARTTKQEKYKGKHALFGKYLKRGLKIFCLGLVITFATWISIGYGFIVFGILHFIGLSIVLAYPFLKSRFWDFYLPLGAFLIIAGLLLRTLTFSSPWLMWLGFTPTNFYTFDYFPLLPWFGIVLIGLYFGNLLYPNGLQRFKVKDLSKLPLVKTLSFLGRHSLVIYFLHQPIVIALLYLFVL